MDVNESRSETKRRLVYLLKEYVDASVGEIRDTFSIPGAHVSAIEWEGNRIYVALPTALASVLNDLIREGRVKVRPFFGTENFISIETSRRAFLFKQPRNSYVRRDRRKVSMEGRYVGLLFRLER